MGVSNTGETDAPGSADEHPRPSRQTPQAQPTDAPGSHVGRGGREGRGGGEEGAQRPAPHAAPPRFSEQQTRAEVPHVPDSAESKNAEEGVTARSVLDVARVSETVAAASSPFCPQHPQGTREPCRACGDVRKAHDVWKRAQPQSIPSAPPALQLFTVKPGARCEPGRHKRLPDGSCVRCDIRPWQLEEEEGGGTVRSAAATAKAPRPSEPAEHPEPTTLAADPVCRVCRAPLWSPQSQASGLCAKTDDAHKTARSNRLTA